MTPRSCRRGRRPAPRSSRLCCLGGRGRVRSARRMTAKVRRGLMRWIVETSLRFRFIVVAVAVLMMAIGSLQLAKMPVDVFPEFAPPRVEIQTMCNGLSTGDVESLVTVPLEQVLPGIEGLEDMRSKSVPQLSSIQLIF